jgi:tRNA threonylcarbamoyl adenosine modification protein YeaZ
MTNPFIIIQYPYEYIDIALCTEKTILKQIKIDKCQAIELLIPTIDQLLADHHLILTDLACISVNRGPGPYNTLRSIIATVNGLHFTHKIPFIEVEALPLLLKAYSEPTIALLNAFSKRVYFGINIDGNITQELCAVADIPALLEKYNLNNNKITCIGNGTVVYKNELAVLAPQLEIPTDAPLFNDLQIAVNETYRLMQEKRYTNSFTSPVYFT